MSLQPTLKMYSYPDLQILGWEKEMQDQFLKKSVFIENSDQILELPLSSQ